LKNNPYDSNNIPDLLVSDLGVKMGNIRCEGDCPLCGRFKKPKCKHGVKAIRWFVDFNHEGKKIYRGRDLDGKTLKTFQDASALITKARHDIEKGIFNLSRWKSKTKYNFSFNFLSDKWYKEKAIAESQGRLAPSYVCKIFSYLKTYYLPYFHNQDVRQIFNVKDFVNQLPKMSLKYMKNIVDGLHNFFRWCIEEKYINDMPVFPKIEVPEHLPTIIDFDTQMNIINFIPEEHKPIFYFLFLQGSRISEARALKWDSIEDDKVWYRRTFSKEKLYERTKTKRIYYHRLFPETKAILPRRGFPLDFVFTHGKKLKRHYSRTFLQSLFNKALKSFNEKYGASLKIGLYEASKHSAFSQMHNNNTSLEVLRKWGGHTSTKTTEKYARLKTEDAFNKIQRITPPCGESVGIAQNPLRAI